MHAKKCTTHALSVHAIGKKVGKVANKKLKSVNLDFQLHAKKYTRDGIRRRNLQSYIFVKGHKFGMVAACTRVKRNLIDLHQ
jgi:hypothetical protein